MSEQFVITVPVTTILQQEDGWTKPSGSDHVFSIVRCHFLVRDAQAGDPVKMGEVVSAFTVEKGFQGKDSSTVEVEYTETLLKETVEESLAEDTSVREYAASLTGELAKGIAKLGGNFRFSAQNTFKTSLKDTFKIGSTRTFREKRTFTKEFTTRPEDITERTRFVVCKGYKRHVAKLYLAYVDYLTVEYKRRGVFSLRRYRSLSPPAKESNVEKAGLPLVQISYWRELPQTALAVREADHSVEVDPFDFTVEPLDGVFPYVPVAPQPRLHEIARALFPEKR